MYLVIQFVGNEGTLRGLASTEATGFLAQIMQVYIFFMIIGALLLLSEKVTKKMAGELGGMVVKGVAGVTSGLIAGAAVAATGGVAAAGLAARGAGAAATSLGNRTDNASLKKFGSRSCLLYTSPSPRDKRQSRMPSSA